MNKLSNRNYGIDLLRLVAAFFVLILHCVLCGGIYGSASAYSHQYYACQMLMSISYCAVPLFGIISGYVGYSDSKNTYNFTRYFLLWLEVVFYGVLITLVSGYISPVGTDDVLRMLFPVSNDLYWYFTAYSLLFLFIPLLNNGIRECSDKTLRILFLLILLLVSPFENLTNYFYSNGGYSSFWLIVLYILGAIVKKLQIGSRISSGVLVVGILGITVVTFYLYRLLPYLYTLGCPFNYEIMERYTFPPYLYCSILYVVLFARFRFADWLKKCIAFASPAAFAIYLVNVHPFIWEWMSNRFVSWSHSSVPGLTLRVLAFSSTFMIAVVVLDFFRRRLFRPLRVIPVFAKK